jgi:hypothetical protein
MSTATPQANLVDQTNPSGPNLPLFGNSGPYGGAQIPNSLLFNLLVELRVQSYYLHALVAGIPVTGLDQPSTIRQQELTDNQFVNFN